MRPLEVIMKDLTLCASDIQAKQTTLEKLNQEQSNAAVALSNAQNKAVDLRIEMEEFLNLLVPTSAQGRVRQSS